VFMPLVRVILSSGSSMVSGCVRPVAVSLDGDCLWPEHLGVAVAYLPAWEVATDRVPRFSPGCRLRIQPKILVHAK
jgi:hypothetical protein